MLAGKQPDCNQGVGVMVAGADIGTTDIKQFTGSARF